LAVELAPGGATFEQACLRGLKISRRRRHLAAQKRGSNPLNYQDFFVDLPERRRENVLKMILSSWLSLKPEAEGKGLALKMPFLRLSQKLVRSQQFASNDPLERVIAQGRLVACALVLWAAHLEAAPYPAYGLLISYSGFAAAIAGATFVGMLNPLARFSTCLVDIATAMALMILTGRVGSPVLALPVFVLLSISLRSRSQGVLAATAVLVVSLLAAGTFTTDSPMTAEYRYGEAATPVIQAASLAVIGAMLAYVTAYRDRCLERLRKLALWPSHEPGGSLEPALARSAQLMRAPRILVVWEEAQEPRIHIAYWHNGAFRHRREAPGRFGELIAPRLASSAPFLTENSRSESAPLLSGYSRSRGPLIDPELAAEFSITSVVTAPFAGELCSGRIFALDGCAWSDHDLVLAEIIAARIGIELDRQSLDLERAETIASRERARLIRDLHDSTLQNLTAGSLQLSFSGDESAKELQMRLAFVTRLLAREQARIRSFVQDIASVNRGETVLIRDLEEPLAESALYWDCRASLSVRPENATIPPTTARELSLMLAEGVANAAHHGRASKVDVSIEQAAGELLLKIRDNGSGFHECCTNHGQEMASVATAPASLSGRAADLGGTLAVSATTRGAELEIRIPAARLC
jgi:signal transduction histidine kinase